MQMVEWYGEETVNAVSKGMDTTAWTSDEWEERIGLYLRNKKAEEEKEKEEEEEAGNSSTTISQADRTKINGWEYTPSDELYLKYKEVYDNPLYYDQVTGKIHWPPEDGFQAGSKVDEVVKKDTIFKRYGENSGEFLGNATDTFESRALAPHSENAKIHYYRLVEDYEMTTGRVAPWFGSNGGAEQFVKYKPDGSKYTIKELEDAGILEDITDLVEKGEIKVD